MASFLDRIYTLLLTTIPLSMYTINLPELFLLSWLVSISSSNKYQIFRFVRHNSYVHCPNLICFPQNLTLFYITIMKYMIYFSLLENLKLEQLQIITLKARVCLLTPEFFYLSWVPLLWEGLYTDPCVQLEKP